MIRFIDREGELSALEMDWNGQNNAFIVVFGRRRIGKTRLLDHFFQGKEGVRYTAEDTSTKIQIRDFKNA
ncbi:MAG: ATP-binding protein, partial [Nanoarchaeota archaeon]